MYAIKLDGLRHKGAAEQETDTYRRMAHGRLNFDIINHQYSNIK